MTTADRNDLMPAQEKKLEWVTPKISLMGAGDTDGSKVATNPVEGFSYFRVNAVGS
jgi:hypothetical protein